MSLNGELGTKNEERVLEMTDRLYYENSFLFDFVAALVAIRRLPDGRTALVLDRTAFYPTSGGQTFDTGWVEVENLDHPQALDSKRGPQATPLSRRLGCKLRVAEVLEDESTSDILHVIDDATAVAVSALPAGETQGAVRVRGFIDVERRRDHLQQHSGQHLLSAAFVELFGMETVSFHMGEESCTIDLDGKALTPDQVRRAERRANEIVFEDRPVTVQFVTREEAGGLGLRKLPPEGRERLRVVGIADYDQCACGGTHVRSTGQVGAVLLRKVEKVKQGVRVEFVCGERAVHHARRDYETLSEAAGIYSAHLWSVPEQVRKSQDELKAAAKAEHKLLEEVAELRAVAMLTAIEPVNGVRIVAHVLAERDLAFTKMLAQKIATQSPTVALLGATAGQPAIVFAQSRGGSFDMGALMKQEMTRLGSRGGGSRELAQGGVASAEQAQDAIQRAKAAILQGLGFRD